jgi:four helix bundle protein
MTHDNSQDIRDRTFAFGCAIARLALNLSPRPGVRCIVDQLLRSGTSVGANLEEAKAASSDREFLRDVQISLREARESVYWLRMCRALSLANLAELESLIGEGDQLAKILAAIVVSKKRRMKVGLAVFAFCILTFAF